MYNPKKPKRNGYITPADTCEDIGLIMPQSDLSAYFSYSGTKKKISFDEIYILDSLYTSCGAHAIKSLRTNDSFIGESWGDLVAKHEKIYGEDAPITLESLLDTPDKFIEKLAPPFDLTRQTTLASPLSLYCRGCARDVKLPTFKLGGGKGFGVYTRIDRKDLPVLDSSYLYALLPAKKLSREEYEDSAVKVISLAENSGIISRPTVIGDRGIIGEILKLDRGAEIYADLYPANPACATFASTLSAFAGCGAFLVTEKNKEHIRSLTSNSGLVAIECARINSDNSVTVIKSKRVIADLDLYYLKSTNAYVLHDVVAKSSEADDAALGARLSSLKNGESIVQKRGCGAYEDEARVISCASCDINENSVHNAIYAALLPIFELAAKGVDRRSITVSKRLELDSAPDASSAVSAITALGRAQLELSLRGEGNGISLNSESSRLHIFAKGNKTVAHAPSDSFSQNGNGLYILSPMRADSGIPSFDNIRKLLDYIYAIIRKGVVKSARVFAGTPINAAISSMNTNGIEAITRPLDSIVRPPLYLIVEATEQIGGTHIGETRARDAAAFEPAPNDFYGFEKSNIKTPTPHVLLINYGYREGDIPSLTKSFSRRGAKVKLVDATLEKKCLDYLADVIPQAHIIIFCGDDELIANALCDARIHEALVRYKEERGLLIAFGKGAISALSDLHYLPAIYVPISRIELNSRSIELYSKNMPSAYSSKKISYSAELHSDAELICGDCDAALVCASLNGEIFSDGLVSGDGLALGVYSLLCDEIIESAIKYYS